MILDFGLNSDEISVEEKARLYLFGRWLSTCYSSSELNYAGGIWWLKTIYHFNNVVLPNYKENGSYKSAIEYIEDKNNEDLKTVCAECGREVNVNVHICRNCEGKHLPF